ncbi:MAG: glutathione S-transferase N-terminal domain-containing protein [Hyphomicrobiales bacterium]
MTLKLFDLAGQDDAMRFSPFCWRAKMALRHKGLEVEELPWRFTEKDRIAQTGQGRVPVLVDGDRWIHESWDIALYLDERYPGNPLMAGDAERAAARFLTFWADGTLHPLLRPLVILPVFNVTAEKDKPYFRENREKMLGVRLEDTCKDRAAAITSLHKALAPLESTLAGFAFLGGGKPNFSDYVVFGSLQWANVVCAEEMLPANSSVSKWFGRMLDLFGGYARKAPTVPKHAA